MAGLARALSDAYGKAGKIGADRGVPLKVKESETSSGRSSVPLATSSGGRSRERDPKDQRPVTPISESGDEPAPRVRRRLRQHAAAVRHRLSRRSYAHALARVRPRRAERTRAGRRARTRPVTISSPCRYPNDHGGSDRAASRARRTPRGRARPRSTAARGGETSRGVVRAARASARAQRALAGVSRPGTTSMRTRGTRGLGSARARATADSFSSDAARGAARRSTRCAAAAASEGDASGEVRTPHAHRDATPGRS